MEKETTPIEQIALEKYPIDLGHGVGNGIDYNYNNRLAFLNAFTYLGLSDIPDPKLYIENITDAANLKTYGMIKQFGELLKTKIALEAENEKLKEALTKISMLNNSLNDPFGNHTSLYSAISIAKEAIK
jgi:hypothetical protein